MKIYTKRGDLGETDLYGSGRVKKSDLRVDAYGTVDECNAMLGLARAFIDELDVKNANIVKVIDRLQNELFNVGAELASPKMLDKIPKISESHIELLETEIDEMEKQLLPLKNFILPTGHKVSAFLHATRTICRRAERQVVELHQKDPVRDIILKYLNRLSDHLFVLARFVNHQNQHIETQWKQL